MLEVMSVEVMSGYSSRRPDMYRNKRPKEGHLTFRCIEQTQHCPTRSPRPCRVTDPFQEWFATSSPKHLLGFNLRYVTNKGLSYGPTKILEALAGGLPSRKIRANLGFREEIP